MSRIITVFGATGNQGGSVVKHVLAHPELSKTYKIRAVTRDVDKPAAQALRKQGCEVVFADLNIKDSVQQAVQGAYAVFGVTNFWESLSADIEVQQGKNIADASKAGDVSHLIWSSLPHVSKESHGELTGVKHFDSKATVEAYIRSHGVPATFVIPGGFMSTQLENFRPTDDVPPTYAAYVPFDPTTTYIPLVAAEHDTGLFVSAALINGPEGKRVACVESQYTPQQITDIYARASGRKAQVTQISLEVFKSFLPPPIKEEIAENMLLMDKYGYYIGEDKTVLEKSAKYLERARVGNPTTWEQYVAEHVKSDV